MRRERALLAIAAALVLSLAASLAFAQRVVLVRPPAPDEVLSEAFNRLRAELALQGFETLVVDLDPKTSTPEMLSDEAQKAGAFAGISLTRRVGTPAAEVCIADRVTGKTSLRTIALSQDPDAPSVLAVRAADLLRSSLREFAVDQKPPPEVVGVDPKPMPVAVRRWVRLPPAPFRLDARFAVLGMTQTIGPGYAPSLALGYRVFGRFGVGAMIAGPALGASFKTNVGSASVRQEMALARVFGAVLQTSTVELRPSLAAGVYHLDARGEVNPPLVSQSAQVTSFAGGIGLELDVRLGHALVLGGEVCALALTPRPAVAMLADEYVLAWPFMTASLGLGVEF